MKFRNIFSKYFPNYTKSFKEVFTGNDDNYNGFKGFYDISKTGKLDVKTINSIYNDLLVYVMSKTKFFGNGRMNKYYRRKALSHKRKLGKAKKQKAINKLKDKEKRWMTYQDHCISKRIINFAIQNNVSQINLEKLSGIRQSTRKSRKNRGYIHRWSFYRLQQFIEYKANRVGIKVVYVNPKYTSQICPICGKINKAEDRLYCCSECGYSTHRDRVGAINIMRVSTIDGNSLSA